MSPTLTDLRRLAAHFGQLRDDSAASAARNVARAKDRAAGTFERGQASAFAICAAALERLISHDVVSEGLAATVKELERHA